VNKRAQARRAAKGNITEVGRSRGRRRVVAGGAATRRHLGPKGLYIRATVLDLPAKPIRGEGGEILGRSVGPSIRLQGPRITRVARPTIQVRPVGGWVHGAGQGQCFEVGLKIRAGAVNVNGRR